MRRLDNYEGQNGSAERPLTSRQDRRRIHKERHELARLEGGGGFRPGLGGVFIVTSRAKNRPTPRRPSRVTRNAARG